jgi:hypothetical protein
MLPPAVDQFFYAVCIVFIATDVYVFAKLRKRGVSEGKGWKTVRL